MKLAVTIGEMLYLTLRKKTWVKYVSGPSSDWGVVDPSLRMTLNRRRVRKAMVRVVLSLEDGQACVMKKVKGIDQLVHVGNFEYADPNFFKSIVESLKGLLD